MKSLNTKLVLSALGIALLATPAFAQKPTHQTKGQQSAATTTTESNYAVGTYPNFSIRSGSEESEQSGVDWNLMPR
jgi:hypothetical protein